MGGRLYRGHYPRQQARTKARRPLSSPHEHQRTADRRGDLSRPARLPVRAGRRRPGRRRSLRRRGEVALLAAQGNQAPAGASERRRCDGHGHSAVHQEAARIAWGPRMRLDVTGDLWWKNAVVYCLDIETFLDSDGDGIGDLPGLISQIDYLAGLGVTCLWLMPFYPTPNRDDGYDVSDYFGVDERLGTLGDFVEFVHTATARGLRVVVDLVVNHTSDEHPWFQAARSDPDSPLRDFYIWRDEPSDEPKDIAFPD